MDRKMKFDNKLVLETICFLVLATCWIPACSMEAKDFKIDVKPEFKKPTESAVIEALCQGGSSHEENQCKF